MINDVHMNEQELLLAYRPWLRAVSRAMLSEAMRRHAEDVAAEGWIAIWRELYRVGWKADEPWLKTVARNRMRDVVKAMLASNRDERQTLYADDLTELWEGEETLGAVELAYHRGQIAQALDQLTPKQREYVYLRFFCGWQKTELNEHFAMASANNLWKYARPKLALALAHLAPEGWQPKIDGRTKLARASR